MKGFAENGKSVLSARHSAQAPAQTTPLQVALLGASNLRLSAARAVREALRRWGCPTRFVVAGGFGRSYGVSTWCLGRAMSPLLKCRLWELLSPDLPTVAVVSDVGNDLLYGYEVEQILAWVAECVERLRCQGATVVVCGLPVENLPRLGPWRFHFFRRLFFPRCQMSLEQIAQQAWQLQHALEQLARQWACTFVPLRWQWYGVDPIHMRRKFFTAYWSQVFEQADLCLAKQLPGRSGCVWCGRWHGRGLLASRQARCGSCVLWC